MVELASRRLPAVPSTEWLTAVAPALRFVLHADAAARAAVGAAWGAGFSEAACRAVVGDGCATLWLGPDEYLLLGADPAAEDATSAALERALAAVPHALVNISHRQFALEVNGPNAASILSGACPLDLDLRAFPIDMCTRTVFAKADIVLWRTQQDAFHLEVWRSFAGYVTGLLSEFGLEFYG
jgi:sarcosine oxidase subunit gamma